MIGAEHCAQNHKPTRRGGLLCFPPGGTVIRSERGDPPPNWSPFPVARLTDDIYYGWTEGDEKPWFYHWCRTGGRWAGHGTGNHVLVSREPLTLEPSLHWPGCCGLHGWCRQGVWQDA